MRIVVARVVLLLPLAGCGYTTGLSLAPEYRSIGIELFGNDTPLVDLERDLHEELSRSTRNLLDAELLVPSEAQLVVKGRILEYRRRGGVRSRQNELLETAITIHAEADLWDRVLQEKVAGPVSARVQVGYTLDEQGNELPARRRAVRNLADRIVIELVTRARRTAGSNAEYE